MLFSVFYLLCVLVACAYLTVIYLLCVLVACAYLTVIYLLHKGIQKLVICKNPQGNTFSIVIAARNEENTIGNCLDSIFKQTIDQSRYEVIVVNDRSTDKTAQVLVAYAQKYPLKILTIDSVPPGIAPKKYAINKGIEIVNNEIIAITDADCLVKPSWLHSLDCNFVDNVGLVQGITYYIPTQGMNPLFFGLQAVDFFSHVVVAASAIGANIPINSNANNLSFRKKTFHDVNGYGDKEGIVSGDDDLLVQRVWNQKKWKVIFNPEFDGSVETYATPTISGVLQQRKRWGSKTIHYNPQQVLLLSIIFVFYLVTAFTICTSFYSKHLALLAILLFGIKVSGEFILMIPGTIMAKQVKLLKYLIPASLLQLGVVLYAVLSGVLGKFSWKDQQFRRKM